MATTAASRAMTMTSLRTGLSCSFLSSSIGFLTKGSGTSASESDHYNRNEGAPLEFVHPRPAAQLTFTSIWNTYVTNAPYKAYPSAVGGAFPYIWTLIGAPSGMAIESVYGDITVYADRAKHGRITWASPTTGTHNFKIRCTDQNGKCVTQAVSLSVADSNGIWVDTVSGTDSTGAAGTFAAPFKKISNFYGGAGGTGVSGDRADTTYQSKIVFFKTAGTYTVPVDEAGQVLGLGSNKPTTWIAYNDVAAVLDCSASAIALNGNGGTANRLEFIGLTTKYEDTTDDNTFQMIVNPKHDEGTAGSASTIAAAGHVIICDHTIDSWQNQGTVGDDNCGAIRMSDPDGATGLAKKRRRIQMRNIRIVELGGGVQGTTSTQAAAILPMATHTSEYNNVTLVSQNGECRGILKLKHHHENVEVRCCDIRPTYTATAALSCQGGGGITLVRGPRVEYNLLYLDPTGLGVNEGVMRVSANNAAEGKLGAMWFRRNTFTGYRPQLTNFDPAATPNSVTRGSNLLECASTWNDNASWSGYVTQETTDFQASSGLVDADGKLEGSYRTSYLGTKGWEIA